MIKAHHALAALLHRLGVAGPAGVCAFRGSGALKAGCGTSVVSVRWSGRTFHPLSRLKCCVPALLCAVVGFFAFSAPALAAGPPEIGPGGEFTSPTAKPSEEVRLEAAINPNEEPTKCDFQYGETVAYGHEAPCTEPGETAEGTEQRAAVTVTGLKPGTTYHCRVVLKNTSGKVEGPDAEFTTAAEPPEAPETTGSKSVTATSAVLEGVLNPHSTAKAGWYFAYTTEPVCVPTLTTPLEGEETVNAKPEHVEVKGLEPNREYTFCMVATDEGGAQATPSATELKFTTKPAPPTVVNEGAGANSTEATLYATVNPNNEETKYFFEYSTTGTAGAGGSITGTIVEDPRTPGILPLATKNTSWKSPRARSWKQGRPTTTASSPKTNSQKKNRTRPKAKSSPSRRPPPRAPTPSPRSAPPLRRSTATSPR